MAIGEQQTLVMCDQLATVDLNRLTEPIGFLTIDAMERVGNALAVVLDL
jgi:mRNA interferase MazF